MAPRRPWNRAIADRNWRSARETLDGDRRVVNPKALAHADAGGARARQAPPEAELEGAPASPPRQAATSRVGANAISSAGKTTRSACVPAPQETQSTQCPRSWSGPRSRRAAAALTVVGGDEDGNSRGSAEHRRSLRTEKARRRGTLGRGRKRSPQKRQPASASLFVPQHLTIVPAR